jgi:hypothetical protein
MGSLLEYPMKNIICIIQIVLLYLYQQLVILSFIKETIMSLTKSQYDQELMQNENEEEQQELNAMFFYELNRRQQLWFESLPNLTQAEKDCYLQLPENFWFSDMFEAFIQVQNESKAIDALLSPQIRMVNRKAESDMNVSDPFSWMNTEANRAELINRNGDV